MNDIYYNTLQHHGILGMHWGIRRYQNKDGSLTPAGKKRYAELEGELDKLGDRKAMPKPNYSPPKKPVSEFSDEELRDAVARLNLEKQYRDNLPKYESNGEKFAKKLATAEKIGKSTISLYGNVYSAMKTTKNIIDILSGNSNKEKNNNNSNGNNNSNNNDDDSNGKKTTAKDVMDFLNNVDDRRFKNKQSKRAAKMRSSKNKSAQSASSSNAKAKAKTVRPDNIYGPFSAPSSNANTKTKTVRPDDVFTPFSSSSSSSSSSRSSGPSMFETTARNVTNNTSSYSPWTYNNTPSLPSSSYRALPPSNTSYIDYKKRLLLGA